MANEFRNKRSPHNGDDGDQPAVKRSRNDDPEIRLLLPSKNAGAVIGKGGENIKRLRQDFQARITLPDSPGPERLMLVRGEISQICGIVSEIIPLLDKPDKGNDDDCDVRMLVHQSHAGRIIGKGGERIKELKEETETQIRVYTECCPESTDRCCQILGKPSQVATCVGRILEMLEDTPVKGPNFPYNPNNFDEGFASKYGGFSGFRGGPGGRMGGSGGRFGGGDGDRRGAMRGGRGGGRDFGDRSGRDFGGRGGRDFGGRGDRDFGGRDFGGSRGGGFDRGMGGDGLLGAGFGGGFGGGMGGMKNFLGGLGGMDKTTTSQVSIPKSLAGAIIGKGGSRIRQVQMESGTVINMDDASVDSEERIITIHGTQEQIQYAQYLLQMTVKQHAGM